MLHFTLVPWLKSFGFVLQVESNEPLSLGLIIYWTCHVLILLCECVVFYRVHVWLTQQTVHCPKCDEVMDVIDKPFAIEIVYLCRECKHRVAFKSQNPRSG